MHIVPFETTWHLISAFIVILLGFLAILKIRKWLKVPIQITTALYLWHSFLSIVYMAYTLKFGGDSLKYYQIALQSNVELEPGSGIVIYLVNILIDYFGLSYSGVFLSFNIIGSIGLLLLYSSLQQLTTFCSKNIRRLALLVVFLPSISFWSSALGKDSISFFAANLALWAALNLPRRKLLMTTAIATMLLVRPHMAGIMIIALTLSLIIGAKQINLMKKTAIISMALPIALILVPFATNYAGIQNITDLTEVGAYIEKRQSYNMGGGSSIDISGMPLPMQLFTYLFRPLPYEAHNISSLFSSLDNLVLLLLFIYAIRFVGKKPIIPANHAFLWLYSGASLLILAMTTANMGIAVRQKWMFMPMLIYLLFAGIAAHQAQKQRKRLARMQVADNSNT